MSVLCVQCGKLIARSDGKDARLLPVGPVRDAAAVFADTIGSRAFIQAPDPQGFAASWINGNYRTSIACGEVKNTVHHDGRCFVFDLGLSSEIIAAPDPGNLE